MTHIFTLELSVVGIRRYVVKRGRVPIDMMTLPKVKTPAEASSSPLFFDLESVGATEEHKTS